MTPWVVRILIRHVEYIHVASSIVSHTLLNKCYHLIMQHSFHEKINAL